MLIRCFTLARQITDLLWQLRIDCVTHHITHMSPLDVVFAHVVLIYNITWHLHNAMIDMFHWVTIALFYNYSSRSQLNVEWSKTHHCDVFSRIRTDGSGLERVHTVCKSRESYVNDNLVFYHSQREYYWIITWINVCMLMRFVVENAIDMQEL